MSTTVDILCFYCHPYNQLVKVKYAFNLETLINVNNTNFQSLDAQCTVNMMIQVTGDGSARHGGVGHTMGEAGIPINAARSAQAAGASSRGHGVSNASSTQTSG